MALFYLTKCESNFEVLANIYILLLINSLQILFVV